MWIFLFTFIENKEYPMKNLTYLTCLLLVIPVFSVFSQGVGINTSSPQATLHINGTLKFEPKVSNATRLVGVVTNGGVKEFELGDTFNITSGTLEVTPAVDPNVFLIGDVNQADMAQTTSQYDNFDMSLNETNIDKMILRISGETSGYSVTGFSDGYDGRIIYYYNSQNVNVTFFDNHSGSNAQNQIITGSGANEAISSQGVAEFIYDGSLEKWILINLRS